MNLYGDNFYSGLPSIESYLLEEEKRRLEQQRRLEEQQRERLRQVTTGEARGPYEGRDVGFFRRLAGGLTDPSAASTMTPEEEEAARRSAIRAMGSQMLRFVENGGWYSGTLANVAEARDKAMQAAEASALARRDQEQALALQEQERSIRDAERVRVLGREDRDTAATEAAVNRLYSQIAGTDGNFTEEDRKQAAALYELPPEQALEGLSRIITGRTKRTYELEDRAASESAAVNRDMVNFEQQRQLYATPRAGSGSRRPERDAAAEIGSEAYGRVTSMVARTMGEDPKDPDPSVYEATDLLIGFPAAVRGQVLTEARKLAAERGITIVQALEEIAAAAARR